MPAPTRTYLFVLLLIGSTALPFVLLDLIEGGSRSITPRYMIPSYLGIGLSMAYLLAEHINFFHQKIWQKGLWRIVTVALIIGGILSCSEIAQAQTWWNKYTDSCIPWTAKVINQSSKPLVIASYNPAETDLGHALTLSHLLDQRVKLALVTDSNLPDFSNQFSEIFLYRSPSEVLDKVSQTYQLEPVNGYKKLYHLIFPP